MELETLIKAAKGDLRIDLRIKNARIVNVLSGEIYEGDLGVHEDRIVGEGDYDARQVFDAQGLHLSPGLIDGHVHLESSMVQPSEFARAVVPRGTTSVVIDPHEIANVLGLDGIRYILDASKDLPLTIFVMLPSCVPATHMETAGSELHGRDLHPLLVEERVLGMAEMMNYPGVIYTMADVIEKIRPIHKAGGIIDGHAPGVFGKDLNAYVAAGIGSDHECTEVEEARDKLRRGMYVMIREGTTERNLEALLPVLNAHNSRRCMLVTDDRHPGDILREGHIDFLVRTAIARGVAPLSALQMATINPADYFRLRDRGRITPGARADLIVFDDFEPFNVEHVFSAGKLVASRHKMLHDVRPKRPPILRNTVNVRRFRKEKLQIPASARWAKIIKIQTHQILTEKVLKRVKSREGLVVTDVDQDILKLAVVERHQSTGNVGVGLVQGFGLQRGALASSVAHDSHNIISVGVTDEDIYHAVTEIEEMGGGLVAVADGEVLGRVALPVAGLISLNTLEVVEEEMEALLRSASKLGSPLPDPFMTMSFLALPVIPELRLTDKGLVDVQQFAIVPLFEKEDRTGMPFLEVRQPAASLQPGLFILTHGGT
jgi:adenine deaminase